MHTIPFSQLFASSTQLLRKSQGKQKHPKSDHFPPLLLHLPAPMYCPFLINPDSSHPSSCFCQGIRLHPLLHRASGVIFSRRKKDHVTPLLKSPQWLPVSLNTNVSSLAPPSPGPLHMPSPPPARPSLCRWSRLNFQLQHDFIKEDFTNQMAIALVYPMLLSRKWSLHITYNSLSPLNFLLSVLLLFIMISLPYSNENSMWTRVFVCFMHGLIPHGKNYAWNK